MASIVELLTTSLVLGQPGKTKRSIVYLILLLSANSNVCGVTLMIF